MKRLHRLSSQLLTYFHTQLFITLVSLPLLLTWGLPISLASVAGNLLFAPALSAVLLLASLIFFGELLSFPTTLLTLIFEWITYGWFSLLTMGSPSWLCSARQPSFTAGALILVISFALVHCRWLKHRLLSTGALFALLTIVCLSLSWFVDTGIVTIPYHSKELTLINGPHTALIDPGVLSQKGAPHWVATTLVPTLRKKGISRITTLVCLTPSITTFQAIACLIDALPISHLYIPAFETHTSIWSSWETLLARATHTHISSFKHNLLINLGATQLTLYPEALITKNKLTYMTYTYQLSSAA